MATYKVSLDKKFDADLRAYCKLTTGKKSLNPFITELIKSCIASYRASKPCLAGLRYLGHHEDREEGRKSWRRKRGRKLSETQVKSLVRFYTEDGMPIRMLAKRFAVGESTALRCLRRAGLKLP